MQKKKWLLIFFNILERAQIRINEAMKRYEEEIEEQKKKELGPGGLHPADVMDSLPQVRWNTV